MTQHAASDGDDPTRRLERTTKLMVKLELERERERESEGQRECSERVRE